MSYVDLNGFGSLGGIEKFAAGSSAADAVIAHADADIARIMTPLFPTIDASPLPAEWKTMFKEQPITSMLHLMQPIENVAAEIVTLANQMSGKPVRVIGIPKVTVNMAVDLPGDERIASPTGHHTLRLLRIINGYMILVVQAPLHLAHAAVQTLNKYGLQGGRAIAGLLGVPLPSDVFQQGQQNAQAWLQTGQQAGQQAWQQLQQHLPPVTLPPITVPNFPNLPGFKGLGDLGIPVWLAALGVSEEVWKAITGTAIAVGTTITPPIALGVINGLSASLGATAAGMAHQPGPGPGPDGKGGTVPGNWVKDPSSGKVLFIPQGSNSPTLVVGESIEQAKSALGAFFVPVAAVVGLLILSKILR